VADRGGGRGPLLDLIGYDRQYDRVATFLLGDVLVVENLAPGARAVAARRGTTKTIVTLDGEVVDPHGVVTGGSRESSAGVLEQKREIRELEQIVAKLETDYQDALARHVASKQDLAEVTRTIEELGRPCCGPTRWRRLATEGSGSYRDEERRLSERAAGWNADLSTCGGRWWIARRGPTTRPWRWQADAATGGGRHRAGRRAACRPRSWPPRWMS
jgi:chromosome segregation ATPase